MRHPIVHDPLTLGGSRAILYALLKLAAVAMFLIAILAFPAFTQEMASQMPLLRESDPVAIMRLENGRARRDFVSRQDSTRGNTGQRVADAEIVGMHRVEVYGWMSPTIHFDIGSSEIRSDAIAAMEAKLGVLRGMPALRIRIEGQADNRGSTASNHTLASSRADAAKRWLTSRGIAVDRIEAVGFGEARPLCGENNESCWWQNRRAEFVIVADADAVPESRP